jgi:hypothetical protein
MDRVTLHLAHGGLITLSPSLWRRGLRRGRGGAPPQPLPPRAWVRTQGASLRSRRWPESGRGRGELRPRPPPPPRVATNSHREHSAGARSCDPCHRRRRRPRPDRCHERGGAPPPATATMGDCWWKSGPKGGRRHNSPLSSLPPFACSARFLLLLE